MANPPPVRPWFRLASIRSSPPPPPPPAPAPAQEPRLPAFRTASAPSSPQIQPTQPAPQPQEHPSSQHNRFSSSSLPTSPENKNITRVPLPSPSHSPNTSPPPSPLALTPSQSRSETMIPDQPEPKTVLVQKTIDPRPKPWHNARHGKHDSVKESESKEKVVHRKLSESEESGMRVITIAGENRGAYMELIQSPKKHDPKYLHKKGNSNINVDGVESEGSSAEEGTVNKKDKNQKGTSSSSFPMSAYMNSNVQCVNNSLLYHASCSHHDPGVRLSLSKKPSGEGFHLKEHADSKHI
ncbi:hypothetical protein GYH30_008400 [Glycine max]|uniref:Uncharacterized protein n=2 Tax=Glycine soja TaxID=3848 RepID=A0A445LHE4_GLYSO|nr:uncharacterized protein LOC114405347 [Glycine soja]KAH1071886.1 hypothetical protein GYH30_008400 [Glycine max]RZC22565.1 hypothetical protein D0Y65_008271 [Glycine soja]